MTTHADGPKARDRGPTSPRDLSTWKEIGAYLGVDARTAQRYEVELDLPVHRLESGSRNRVYARLEELEAWKRDRFQRPPWWKAVTVLQRLSVTLGFVVVALTGLLIWSLWPAVGPAVRFEHHGRDFVALDSAGNALWHYRLPAAPREQWERSLFGVPPVLLEDLDHDGVNEILYWFRSKFYVTPDILFCFSNAGEKLWSYTPEQRLRDRAEEFSANLHLRTMMALPSLAEGDNTRWVAVSTVAAWGHPSIVALIDIEGEIRGEYAHSGHIEDLLLVDLDRDGQPEIVAGGHNASRDQATVVVLDPLRMSGASVEPPGSAKQILDVGPARGELARVFFPRSAVSLLRRDISTALELYRDGDRVVAQVFEMRETKDDWAFLTYVLRPDLLVEKVRADEFMMAAWDRARAHDPTLPPLDEEQLDQLANRVIVERSDPRFEAAAQDR